jgi:hypothetical protein
VTLYKEQWLKLLDMSDDIRAFIAANEAQLKSRDWLWIKVASLTRATREPTIRSRSKQNRRCRNCAAGVLYNPNEHRTLAPARKMKVPPGGLGVTRRD